MKILIVGIVRNDQVGRVREEAEKRGHSVGACYASDLVIEASPQSFVPTIRGQRLEDFGLIYLWATGKRRWEWYTACLYLNLQHNTTIVNQKVVELTYNYYLSPAADYLKQTENNLSFPKSLIVFSSKELHQLVSGYEFPLIVKVPDGRQGRGVHKVGNFDELEKVVDEITKDKSACVIREFIPNDGDIRVFTVGHKAVGAMKRTPKEGDFRSNISQGGTGEKYDLEANPEVREIAERASEVTKTEIAGVDVMISKKDGKPYILEVNPGPQFMGLEKYTGVNVAGKIVEYFEKLYNARK